MLLNSVRDRVIANVGSEEFTDDAARMLSTVAEALEDESLTDSLGAERIAQATLRNDEADLAVLAEVLTGAE